MTWPLPSQYGITTAYGKRGSSWSCNKDLSGKGVHTGLDIAAPLGTPVFATIAGDIRHRNYGSAFGNHQVAISPDADEPFGKGEVFYAHMRKCLADGTRVKPGDWIGEVGVEGNTTGPHLHYEYHPNSKDEWACAVHADPTPTLGGTITESDGPYQTADIYSNKLGFGEPTNGDVSSDSIKELQEILNRVSLKGGQTLDVNGKYDIDTDEEVRLWQQQVCGDTPDPERRSYLGPKQIGRMFGDQYNVHSVGLPQIAGATTPPKTSGSLDPGTNLSVLGKQFVNAASNVSAKVYYHAGWDTDAIAGKGIWKPKYVVMHHTAGTDSLGWILKGGKWQPVRLANLLVDRDGTLHVCSARLAYQAGAGGPYKEVPKNEMNSYSIGIEIESLGTSKDLTDAQIDTVLDFTREWLYNANLESDVVLNHKDWSPTKQDTLYTTQWWRDQIDYTPSVPPIQPPIQPPIEPPKPPIEQTVVGSATYWSDFSGKPPGILKVSRDAGYVALDATVKAAPVSGFEDHLVYLNLGLVWSGTAHGIVRLKYVRSDGDATGYQDYPIFNGTDSFLITHTHFEQGEAGIGGKWYINVNGGILRADVGTRYCKVAVVAVKKVAV